jgi:hypothetical protein
MKKELALPGREDGSVEWGKRLFIGGYLLPRGVGGVVTVWKDPLAGGGGRTSGPGNRVLIVDVR